MRRTFFVLLAIALDPQWRDVARTEPEFDPIRHESCFQALIAGPSTLQ